VVNKEYGKFLRIECSRCKNGQIIYGKSTMKIKCLGCNKLLVKTTGGKTKVKAIVREVMQ